MKYFFYTLFLLSILACNERKSPGIVPKFGKPADAAMDDFKFSPRTAHPNARKLMNEDFFWSNIDDAAPFGSDAGADAAHLFRQWRARNPSTSPVTYLRELINSWESSYFDWNEMDSAKIEAYLTDTTGAYLLKQDQAIIGTAFAQFVVEGKADTDLQKLAETAIRRQMLPVLLNRHKPENRQPRLDAYNKLLSVVQQMNKQ